MRLYMSECQSHILFRGYPVAMITLEVERDCRLYEIPPKDEETVEHQ